MFRVLSCLVLGPILFMCYIFSRNYRNAAVRSVSTAEKAFNLDQKVVQGKIPDDALWMILNLRRRRDRWRCTLPKFEKAGINPIRVNATDAEEIFSGESKAKNIALSTWLSARQKKEMVQSEGINIGHLATFFSHLDAVKIVKARNARIGCIFEDDVTLADNFYDKVAPPKK